MIVCKNCKNQNIVKNGTVRWEQRYKCKDCSFNFVKWDKRVKPDLVFKKALAIILYSLWKWTFNFIAKIFNVTPALVYRWILEEWAKIEEPKISENIKEMEFDEMWHYIWSKKTKDGLLRPWIVTEGKLLPGLSVIVMLQHSKDSMKK